MKEKIFTRLPQVEKVVLHGGAAHLDDWLVASLTKTLWPNAAIERRDATKKDLTSLVTLVADVGGVYDPRMLNFDHHQDKELPSAIVLVLKWLKGLLMNGYRWPFFTPNKFTGRVFIEDVSFVDTRGPMAAKKAGIPSSDPITLECVKAFQRGDDWALAPGISFFNSEFERIAKEQEMFKFASKRSQMLNLQVGNIFYLQETGSYNVWDLLDAVEAIDDWTEDNPAVIVAPDDRGAGWLVLRRNDHPAFDFSCLDGHEKVLFAHKVGFIFKTVEKLHIDQVIDLIRLGVKK